MSWRGPWDSGNPGILGEFKSCWFSVSNSSIFILAAYSDYQQHHWNGETREAPQWQDRNSLRIPTANEGQQSPVRDLPWSLCEYPGEEVLSAGKTGIFICTVSSKAALHPWELRMKFGAGFFSHWLSLYPVNLEGMMAQTKCFTWNTSAGQLEPKFDPSWCCRQLFAFPSWKKNPTKQHHCVLVFQINVQFHKKKLKCWEQHKSGIVGFAE